MLAEQPQLRKRQRTQRKRRNAYHAPANMSELQQNIAAVTLNHLRQGRAVDFRNLAITYPLAFDLVHLALGKQELADAGVACDEGLLRQRLDEREKARFEALQ